MKFGDLAGKTIVSITQMREKGTDDNGYLEILFSDDTEVVIKASYGMYTGLSSDEYPTDIFISHSERELVPAFKDIWDMDIDERYDYEQYVLKTIKEEKKKLEKG